MRTVPPSRYWPK
jgi:hypothetical protein